MLLKKVLKISYKQSAITDLTVKDPVASTKASLVPRLKNVDTEQVLIKLADYLETDKVLTQSGLTLETVAAELGVRADQLSAIINSQLNTSFPNLINHKRLEKAASMLINEAQESILSISVQCGFGSKSHFNKLFKHQFEIPPSQYRKKFREQKRGE